ncbi:hypothetical protein E2C01_094083 [Portunus trituberculatus]|uniref:Uncharacterized protein n=1 Tax=Portunus trituberculatus TaxID=210409 RepID=A0A5B7JW98_PORTR|nr:hypothetical protein [Portunus trituberculatus]
MILCDKGIQLEAFRGKEGGGHRCEPPLALKEDVLGRFLYLFFPSSSPSYAKQRLPDRRDEVRPALAVSSSTPLWLIDTVMTRTCYNCIAA